MTAAADGSRGDEEAGNRSRRKAFVHVGAPKTGTTYLQSVLWANRRALAHDGVLYPGTYEGAHHDAALELRSAAFGGHRNPNMVAAWDRLVAEADDWDGDLLISSELLAWATPEQTRRAVDSLSPGFEVHVVFTARDLARQVPAVWQEEMKNRRLTSYQDFLRDLLDPESPEVGPAGIWGGQDPRLVMRGWGADVPPEHVHVITVPPPGGPEDELWRRFCSIVGIDPAAYDLEVRTSNVGLGFAEAEMLRRVNAGLPDTFEWPAYRVLVKHGISEGPLSTRVRGSKPPLPDEVSAALAERTRLIIDHVRARGFAVTGDLAELERDADPDDTGVEDVVVDEAHVAAAGVDTVVGLLERLMQTRRELYQAYADLGLDYEESRTEDENLEDERDAEERSEPPPLAPFAGAVDLRPRHRPTHARNKTVFLVVGSPKTGLDRVRDVLWRSRDVLARQDVHLPLTPHDHFLATIDLRGVTHENPGSEGAWTRLTDELSRSRSGTWVIGHELFAPVSAERAIAAMRRLAPAEVHVVTVARGLDRQIPAEWLESLRHGSVTPFSQYADHAVQSLDPRPHLPWFWQVQDPVDIAERWGASLSPGRVHVITSPSGVTDADEQLWLRLCAVIGIDPASADTSPLGAPEEPRPVDSEVLRRLNVHLSREEWAVAGDPPRPTAAYGRAVRDVVANQVLARVPESHSVTLPAAFDVWLARQARILTDELSAKGYDVVGDPQELHPAPAHRADHNRPPERLSERVVLAAALETVAGVGDRMSALIEEVDELRPRVAQLQEERARLQAQVDRLTGPMRAGRKVINAVRGNVDRG